MKLVSIITPTHNRNESLFGKCVPSIGKQTYPNIEHLIITDGNDEFLRGIDGIIQCPRNWKDFTNGKSYGSVQRIIGNYLASGDYIAYLDDDNEYLPEHIESLVNFLEETGSDFVYSKAQDQFGNIIGSEDIGHGYIDTNCILHKIDLIKTSNWGLDGYNAEWELVRRWIASGAKWAFLDKITVKYFKHN